MKRTYKKTVLEALERTGTIKNELLREPDIQHLPSIVQKYLFYTGSVGKDKVLNFRAEFKGGIRSKSTEDFCYGEFSLISIEYNCRAFVLFYSEAYYPDSVGSDFQSPGIIFSPVIRMA